MAITAKKLNVIKLGLESSTAYRGNAGFSGGSKQNENALKNLSNNRTGGIMSKSAQKKCSETVQGLLLRKMIWLNIKGENVRKIGKRVAFVTLTLPAKQRHSDIEIKQKLLNQFLIEIREKYGKCEYIWKAEAQENGNIHFHVLFNRYINHFDVRIIWSRIADKLGYTSEWRQKFGKNENKYPPCTEAVGLKSVKRIGAYISKYMGKNGGRPIEGRLWFPSSELSKFKFPSFELDKAARIRLNELKKEKWVKVYKNTKCHIYNATLLFDKWEHSIKWQMQLSNYIEDYCLN